MDFLEIKTIFTIDLFNFKIPITETVVVSWVVMFILIAAAVILTRKLKTVPTGVQTFLEAGVEFLNNFSKNQFGSFSKYLSPYMGSLFLFLLLCGIMPILSPIEINAFGHSFVPPFSIRPPTRDINVTASCALISIFLVIVCGLASRGLKGWLKNFLYPLPIMLPFNIMEYGTRMLSLALRLFGNTLGSVVFMHLIEQLIPLAVPMVLSLYFDFFDALLQATVFVFLTSLYISEAVNIHSE